MIKQEYQKKPISQTQNQKKYHRRSRFQQIHITKEENSFTFDRRSPQARLRIAQRRLREIISNKKEISIYSNIPVPLEKKQERSKDLYIYKYNNIISARTRARDSFYTKKVYEKKIWMYDSTVGEVRKVTLPRKSKKFEREKLELKFLIKKAFNREAVTSSQKYLKGTVYYPRKTMEYRFNDNEDNQETMISSPQKGESDRKRTTVPVDPKLAQGLATREEMIVRKAKVLWRNKKEREGQILQISPFRARRELANYKRDFPEGLDAFRHWYNLYEQREFRNWLEEKEEPQLVSGDIKSMTFKDGAVTKEYH